MKTVIFLKNYKHTSTRTWKKGDAPNISTPLAIELEKKGIVNINPLTQNTRGISQDELNEEEEKIQREQALEKKKIIVPEKYKRENEE